MQDASAPGSPRYVGWCSGGKFLTVWSKTTGTLALSSGESELAAIVKAMGEGLGFQSSLEDFNVRLPLEIHSDATAAIGMCKREGLGRVRHLSTSDLWVQQAIRQGRAKQFKCPTIDNPSDICTKGVSRPRIQHLMQIMYYQLQGGRSALAPVRDSTAPIMGPLGFDVDEGLSDSE